MTSVRSCSRKPEGVSILYDTANASYDIVINAMRDVSREIGIPVQPSPDTIEIIQACPFFTSSDILFCFSQDKCRQKTHFQANGIPVIDFCDIPDVETLQHICDERLPVMLKAKR